MATLSTHKKSRGRHAPAKKTSARGTTKKKTISQVQPASGLADRQTPLIRNCWYVLDWAADVKRKLKNRMVLNQDLVYFRNKAGHVTVLQLQKNNEFEAFLLALRRSMNHPLNP